MDRSYRCYFLGRDNKIKDVCEFVCADDAVAIAAAQRRFECQRIYGGFELWQDRRQVYFRPPPFARN